MARNVVTVHLDSWAAQGLDRFREGWPTSTALANLVDEHFRQREPPVRPIPLEQRHAAIRVSVSLEEGVIANMRRMSQGSPAEYIRGLLHRRLRGQFPELAPPLGFPPRPASSKRPSLPGATVAPPARNRTLPGPDVQRAREVRAQVEPEATEEFRSVAPRIIERAPRQYPLSDLYDMVDGHSALAELDPPTRAYLDLLDGDDHRQAVTELRKGRVRRVLLGVDPSTLELSPLDEDAANAQCREVEALVMRHCEDVTVTITPTVWWLNDDPPEGVVMLEMSGR